MSYPGGKNGSGVYQTLINLMPPHHVYVEPFLGSGALMRLKRPAILNWGIDLDTEVIERARLAFDDRRPPTPEQVRLGNRPRFLFEAEDGIGFLRRIRFDPRHLVYCDPPYLKSARRDRVGDIYKFEMTDAQHVELLRTLKGLPCMVMISGYSSALYAKELKGWHCTAFQASTRGRPAAEWVWCNYPRPVELHDYRYLGDNFREREHIKRMQKRWIAKLEKMAPVKRQALLAAIAATAGSGDVTR